MVYKVTLPGMLGHAAADTVKFGSMAIGGAVFQSLVLGREQSAREVMYSVLGMGVGFIAYHYLVAPNLRFASSAAMPSPAATSAPVPSVAPPVPDASAAQSAPTSAAESFMRYPARRMRK